VWFILVLTFFLGGNILLDEKGTIKLADFGHSKYLNDKHDSLNIKGTPLWIAPEVITSGKYSKAADIWSLACTIIEMLTGKPPFPELHRLNPYAIMQKISKGLKPSIPNELSPIGKDFLSKCFELNPEDRATVDELLNHSFVNTYYNDEEEPDQYPDIEYTEDTDTDFASSFESNNNSFLETGSPQTLAKKKSYTNVLDMKNSLKSFIKKKESFRQNDVKQTPRVEVLEEIEESIRQEKKKLDKLKSQLMTENESRDIFDIE
jgi:serine/threonine protein kinase